MPARRQVVAGEINGYDGSRAAGVIVPAHRRAQSGGRRAVVVGVAGVAAGLVLVAVMVWLAGPSGQVEVRLGDRDFRELDAARISAEIAERGPVLFSDVAGGSRDIILQHLGADPESGWLAFEARRAGQDRRCFFEWRSEGGGAVEGGGRFVNSCDPDDVVDARGSGLVQFPVTVVDGDVRVDINAAGGG